MNRLVHRLAYNGESSLTSPDADTPIRRPADTLPQPAAYFERNDITIICETVH